MRKKKSFDQIQFIFNSIHFNSIALHSNCELGQLAASNSSSSSTDQARARSLNNNKKQEETRNNNSKIPTHFHSIPLQCSALQCTHCSAAQRIHPLPCVCMYSFPFPPNPPPLEWRLPYSLLVLLRKHLSSLFSLSVCVFVIGRV